MGAVNSIADTLTNGQRNCCSRIIISIIIAHVFLPRDSFTPTMFISFSGIPERVTCKISGRYVPISPTYDPNAFVKNYNKEMHQNFANFDRPKRGHTNEFLNSFFEIG